MLNIDNKQISTAKTPNSSVPSACLDIGTILQRAPAKRPAGKLFIWGRSCPGGESALNVNDLDCIRKVTLSYFGMEAKVWLAERLYYQAYYFENLVYVEAILPEYRFDKIVNATVDLRAAFKSKEIHLLIQEEKTFSPMFDLAKIIGCRLN